DRRGRNPRRSRHARALQPALHGDRRGDGSRAGADGALGEHQGAAGLLLRAFRPRLAPGEAFALNSPYAGGTHLPDITVVMPVFSDVEPEPAFFVAARGHHADVG